jgi:hypothetical protein
MAAANNYLLPMLLICELLVLWRLSMIYSYLFEVKPLVASAVISMVLGSIGETLGQNFTKRLNVFKIIKFVVWGGITAPLQRLWLGWVTENIPYIPGRVALDQLLFSPSLTAAFFLYNSFFDGVPFRAIMKNSYWSTMKASYMVWPFFSFAAFYIIPPAMQLPVGGGVGILWTMFLGLTQVN